MEKLNGVVETYYENGQNTTNMDLFTELGNLLNHAIAVEPVLATGLYLSNY